MGTKQRGHHEATRKDDQQSAEACHPVSPPVSLWLELVSTAQSAADGKSADVGAPSSMSIIANSGNAAPQRG